MEDKKIASECKNFTEYTEYEVRENPNLSFGDGACPGVYYVISGDHPCPNDCKLWEELTIR